MAATALSGVTVDTNPDLELTGSLATETGTVRVTYSNGELPDAQATAGLTVNAAALVGPGDKASCDMWLDPRDAAIQTGVTGDANGISLWPNSITGTTADGFARTEFDLDNYPYTAAVAAVLTNEGITETVSNQPCVKARNGDGTQVYGGIRSRFTPLESKYYMASSSGYSGMTLIAVMGQLSGNYPDNGNSPLRYSYMFRENTSSARANLWFLSDADPVVQLQAGNTTASSVETYGDAFQNNRTILVIKWGPNTANSINLYNLDDGNILQSSTGLDANFTGFGGFYLFGDGQTTDRQLTADLMDVMIFDDTFLPQDEIDIVAWAVDRWKAPA